jgi:hypothetical protein
VTANRPFLVTVLTVLVLMMTSINLIRLIQALVQWRFLSSLPQVSPAYLAGSGLFWSLIGLPLTWGLWRGHSIAPKAARIVALAHILYYWLDRAFLVNAGENSVNWPFAAGVTTILLVGIFWVLSRPYTKAYFGEVND